MRKSNRAAAGAAAWQMVHDGTKPGKPSVFARAGAVPRMLGNRVRGQYTELPASRLVMFLVAIAYIVSPVDLVPELLIPILGFADDIGVVIWLTSSLLGETERYLEWEQRSTPYVQGRVVD
ncbi:DUF1232 domain-containing protein [Nocardiopsis gilva YIM 90087]|uniref:DUF1232 domain-containing protein n=1 Tax=Nocardiopsis gilva YIM 90087 TaxID=1235441 RepID=A0A223S211_9ACTN|nr:YkvA family protein [Nocardiopsis gilva]ASU82107.1 DUF1232 domain-containing protein [Nocardiopsis gilva YIM 90087]